MDQGSTRKRSAVHNFAPTVTKFCVMWEGQALPHDTKFGNSRCEIVGRRVIFIWSLIHGSSWSGLIKRGTWINSHRNDYMGSMCVYPKTSTRTSLSWVMAGIMQLSKVVDYIHGLCRGWCGCGGLGVVFARYKSCTQLYHSERDELESAEKTTRLWVAWRAYGPVENKSTGYWNNKKYTSC